MPRGVPLREIEKGEIFTNLTVIGVSENSSSESGKLYDCLCVCGIISKTAASLLLNGKKTSCGCLRTDKQRSNIEGVRFGLLTAIEDIGSDKFGSRIWRCSCDCGNEVTKEVRKLKTGKTPNCGCLVKQTKDVERKGPYKTHSMTGTPTYNVWANMCQRTNNRNRPDYVHYGGRGIDVCQRWLISKGGSFENFLLDMGEKPDKLSLERVNNDEDYSPENCIWADETTQNYHQRVRKDNTSGVVGVRWDSTNCVWQARLWKGGEVMLCSNHAHFEDAVLARKAAELKFYGYEKSK
ncbi:MAG: hypothetical protein EOO06_01065 [Chitinophagaceae bacterium]|nr:MAG: hypothetical protein EOO06_01065 [Chitinophagaceae bacterium]